MSRLPHRWVQAELGDLCLEVRNGISTKPNQAEGLPILRISAVRPMKLDLDDVRFLPRSLAIGELYALKANDLLFTRYNGSRELVGVCARVPSSVREVVYPDKLIRVRIDEAIACPAYVERAMHAPAARMFIAEKLKTSAGQVGISGADLRRVPVSLAPLAEQKRIADKLDSLLARVDACRQRLDHVPAILKRFRQSILAAATSGELTREWREERGLDGHWPEVTLESVATEFSYGSSAKSSSSGRVPVLRMGNIQDGRLDWGDLVFTSSDSEIEKYRLSPGDVLFNRTNSPELVGKTAVFRGEREAVYAGYLIRVRCCAERLLPDYLNYCLGGPDGRDYCWRVKSDGVSQSNINARKLAAFPFRLPCLAEQVEIARRAEDLFATANALEFRARRAMDSVARLKSSALAKAFRGELVPQDPNDEPASALLERIRAATTSAEAARPKRPTKISARPKPRAAPAKRPASARRRRAS